GLQQRFFIRFRRTVRERRGSKLDFDKFAYVSVDSNLAAHGMLSEAEIVDSIATNNPVEQESVKKSNKMLIYKVINSKEAIDRINELKQFFLTKKDDNSNIFLSIKFGLKILLSLSFYMGISI
ncbi:hypothetical protein BpHYR1_044624, partial [Brachionus plicatilis]